MSRQLKTLSLVFLFVAIIIGIQELSFKKNVFADTLMYCCGNGLCADQYCTAPSSEKLADPPHYPEDCRNYNFTCKDCIDFEISNCICNQNNLNIRCKNDDGSYYYGTHVLCPMAK